MANSLNKQVIEMYRDGATNKNIRLALGIKDIKLKEILEGHKEGVKAEVLDRYDKESFRDGIKERICMDYCIKMVDLDEWLGFRSFQKKAKKILAEKNEVRRLRIQNGFSHWVSYIVEKCYLEPLWRNRK